MTVQAAPATQIIPNNAKCWTVYEDGFQIAHVFGQSQPIAKANALRVAASADLLAACQAAVEELRRLDDLDANPSIAAFDTLRAAIAKATIGISTGGNTGPERQP